MIHPTMPCDSIAISFSHWMIVHCMDVPTCMSTFTYWRTPWLSLEWTGVVMLLITDEPSLCMFSLSKCFLIGSAASTDLKKLSECVRMMASEQRQNVYPKHSQKCFLAFSPFVIYLGKFHLPDEYTCVSIRTAFCHWFPPIFYCHWPENWLSTLLQVPASEHI